RENVQQESKIQTKDSQREKIDTPVSDKINSLKINDSLFTTVLAKRLPDSLVLFAKSLIGTPYKYASSNPAEGFDCSGFITYVFNHYHIQVPRSSKDFENKGTEIPIGNSKRGDLILFTGTDSTKRMIGHMGIVVSNNNDTLKFIHATSGKAYGVVITEFNKYYQGRFVKTIRIFNQ
ncbi:MAG: C40 family peptidase, partial [Bacteroidota bacterium]|nr:C40 family peptidase [Bacteroidota bacterium]